MVLLMMTSSMQATITELTRQRDQARESERQEKEELLAQAQLRLERTEQELAKAREHRYTAEQAQQALLREVEEARRQAEDVRRRAEQAGPDLDIAPVEGAMPEKDKEPPLATSGTTRREDFEAFDEALERIKGEIHGDERDLAVLAEHTGQSPPSHASEGQVVQGVVLSAEEAAADRTVEHSVPDLDGTAVAQQLSRKTLRW
ncbi:hypothetical protein RFN58_00350 [Streptomyces iakyrus]|uniref:hypothetical protein n=1 Tax=Streptomyces iakyrus TaxID=68219 RepID=UPI000526AEBF|nr:hypothetical protein [Streptomyces iakyrus]